jgi:GNAT superfamily N-acetyltransferase
MKFTTIPQIWDDFKCWFIFSDDGLVSCRLSIYKETPQDAIVSDLYTNESIRGQGAANAILDFCFDFAKDKKCNTISLRSDNDDFVRRWYQRIGFEVKSSSLWFTKKI